MFDAGYLLQKTNGADAIIAGIFMAWGVHYLRTEARRRDLTLRSMLWDLPPSMNFVVATIVFDSGVWIRATAAWWWRRSGSVGVEAPWFQVALFAGAALIVVGGLCKVRSVTKPDYGHLPWLLTLAFLAAAWVPL